MVLFQRANTQLSPPQPCQHLVSMNDHTCYGGNVLTGSEASGNSTYLISSLHYWSYDPMTERVGGRIHMLCIFTLFILYTSSREVMSLSPQIKVTSWMERTIAHCLNFLNAHPLQYIQLIILTGFR